MNTSFIKEGWRDKFERKVLFPFSGAHTRPWEQPPQIGMLRALCSTWLETNSENILSTSKNWTLQLKASPCQLSNNLQCGRASVMRDRARSILPGLGVTEKSGGLMLSQSKPAKPLIILKWGASTCRKSSSEAFSERVVLVISASASSSF